MNISCTKWIPRKIFRSQVKSEFLEDLGIERQNIVKTPAKKSRQEKSRQEKVLSKGYTSITSFFGKNAEEKGVSGDINRVEDEKTSKTEESASSNAGRLLCYFCVCLVEDAFYFYICVYIQEAF